MSQDAVNDDAIIRDVEERLLRKPTLSNLEVHAAIVHLAPVINSKPSYDVAHRRKVKRLLKKLFGKRVAHVGVYEDGDPDSAGGYRIHVTPISQVDTIHFTVTV